MIAVLTIATQIGGLAWALALLFRRRLIAFGAVYVFLWLAALFIAPVFGRDSVTCWREGPLQVGSWVYCALNRTYATPETVAALEAAAAEMDRRHPGTTTLLLDAGFPFVSGFPLLPHLSHNDGRKADLAFYYRDGSGYAPGEMRSFLGYFAFEDGPTECPDHLLTMRWDLEWLQPFWRDLALDETRTADLVRALAADPVVEKIFIEPHLKARLDVADGKVRFQGCRAARHDDHIHMQVR